MTITVLCTLNQFSENFSIKITSQIFQKMSHKMLFVAFFMGIFSSCWNFTNRRGFRKPNQQKKLAKDETKEKLGRDWSDIPTQISELILSRLPRADYYRFGGVCTSWRYAMTESINYRSSSPLPSMPLLLIYQLQIFNDLKAGLFSLIEQKMNYPKTPLFRGNIHCLGSIKGWLIMVDTLMSDQSGSSSASASIDIRFPSFFFWNPISDDQVMLPSKVNIPYPVKWYKLFSKVKASSGPEGPDCFVAGLFCAQHHIAFCSPHDESWNIISIEHNPMSIVFTDMELLHDKCYTLTETLRYKNLASILVYDLHDPSPLQPKILINLQQQQLEYPPSFRSLIFSEHILYYLASDPISGDLYLISIVLESNIDCSPHGRRSLPRHTNSPRENKFIVYKVDMRNVPQLVRVQSLNDGILFLSHRDSKMVPSSTINNSRDLNKRNTIYFAHTCRFKENPLLAPQIVEFCITNGRINYIPLPNEELDPQPTCLWFSPTLW